MRTSIDHSKSQPLKTALQVKRSTFREAYKAAYMEALRARIRVEELLDEADPQLLWKVEGWRYGRVLLLENGGAWLASPGTFRVFVPGRDLMAQAVAEAILAYYFAMQQAEAAWRVFISVEFDDPDLLPPDSLRC